MDVLLIAFAVAFGFLAASFAATNSNLWQHLASGRLLASGGYTFGVDPFSYFTEGTYWANHAWLFDLGSYGIHRTDPRMLVLVKALGIAVLAGLMLRLGLRAGGPVWLAAGCTLLAVLAMSPRLLLQPQCLSLLLLGLCLYLLNAGGRALRLVPVLIAFWVNLDGWFLLGPVLVLLFKFGETLTHGGAEKLPRWLLPASFVACLLSPHHVHAFALPPELTPAVWTSGLQDDPRFAGFFASPWRLASFGRVGGYSLAAWAFPTLLVLGVLSFAVNRAALRSWRSLVWLLFAVLASWQVRLVPFFAVVAGPILAMNLGEVIGAKAYLRAGRLAALFASLALVILAWPGWLQSFHARDRAIAWEVVPDPSLVRVAQRVDELRAARAFNAHPDAAHYLAWFAPGVRTGLDSRLQLFAIAHGEHREVCAALGLIPDAFSVKGPAILSAREVSLVVLSDPDRAALASALRTTIEQSGRFSFLEVDGNALLLGLDSPLPRFDAERLAFGPSAQFPQPPAAGPSALAEEPELWNLAAHRLAGRSWEADAAPAFARLFELQTGGTERSPALPLLAVRAARTGIAIHPLADDAWLALARSYLTLGRGSWEATAGAELTPLRFLRHVQVVGALQQVTTRNPDSMVAHELLAGAFGERRILDLTLKHRREQMRLLKRASLAGESVESRDERTARLQESIDEIERSVQDGENRFLVLTFSLAGNPLERAKIARELGLGGKAIDVLVRSHPDLYGVEGVRLLLDLLLQTGRLKDARILLDREELVRNPGALDVYRLPGGVKNGKPWRYAIPAYNWLDFCQCAAAGRYDRAQLALERLREQIGQVEALIAPQELGFYLRTAMFELGPGAAPASLLLRVPAVDQRETWTARHGETRFLASVRGDLHVLGGILHLERGAASAAESEFRVALACYDTNAAATSVYPGRPLAVRYREALLKHAK